MAGRWDIKLSQKMFYQLYTVHIQGPGIAPACMYGFLPNKTESTYKRFLESGKIVIQEVLNILEKFEG